MLIMIVNISIWVLSLAMIGGAFLMYFTQKAVTRRTTIRDKSGNSIGTGKTATSRQMGIMINTPFIILLMGLAVFMLCSLKRDLERGFLPEQIAPTGLPAHTGLEWAGDDNN